MFQKIIHSFVIPRHPWRKIKFDELAEIYTSMSIRSFGFGIIGIFVPIYLYQNGVSLPSIFLFYTVFFFLRIPVSYFAAFVIGKIGPKHSIAVSTILVIVFLSMLLSFSKFEWPLFLLAFSFTIANGLFFIAYNTDFSKIKDSKHGGKELGWLFIFERAGMATGPLVGGIIASLISPEFTIVFAMLVLMGSLIPLFLTNEPVKVHQKITFKGFKWGNHTRDYVSLSAFNIENVASGVMWPLLVGIFIFTEDTYAKLGGIIAIAMIISMFSARMFGKFIDNKHGLVLLQYGTIMNSLTHIMRSTVTAAGGTIAVSTLNEPITLSYKMPLAKATFDAADSEEGYRIVYLASTEMITAIAKSVYCFALFIATYYYDPIIVLRYSFVAVGIISLGILFQRFPALKKV